MQDIGAPLSQIDYRNGSRAPDPPAAPKPTGPPLPPLPTPPMAPPSPPVPVVIGNVLPPPPACTINPPAGCNGHGTVQSCTCVCQSGYANDFTNLVAPSWCVASSSTPSNGGRDVNLTQNGDVYIYPPSSNTTLGNGAPATGLSSIAKFLRTPGGIAVIVIITLLCASCSCWWCWRKCCRDRGRRDRGSSRYSEMDVRTKEHSSRRRRSQQERKRARQQEPHDDWKSNKEHRPVMYHNDLYAGRGYEPSWRGGETPDGVHQGRWYPAYQSTREMQIPAAHYQAAAAAAAAYSQQAMGPPMVPLWSASLPAGYSLQQGLPMPRTEAFIPMHSERRNGYGV